MHVHVGVFSNECGLDSWVMEWVGEDEGGGMASGFIHGRVGSKGTEGKAQTVQMSWWV